MTSQVFNMDCMEGMKQYPDKYFDLAVVDPPYGIDYTNSGSGDGTKTKHRWINHQKKDWDKSIPDKDYFEELFRVSKNQVVWGANYMTNFLPHSRCWIIWDKIQEFSLADFEMAWTSFASPCRAFRFSRGEATLEKKHQAIHPTQKPIKLYKWIYSKFLPEGGKVLDTHLGSGSNRIAADKAGNIDFVGYELDKDYFEAQEKRWANYKAQLTIFA